MRISWKDVLLFGWVKHLLKFLSSPRGKQILEETEKLAKEMLPKAVQVVQTIAALTPNKTDKELAVLLTKYGIPIANWAGTFATDPGASLMKVAQTLLEKEFPNATRNQIQDVITDAIELDRTNKKVEAESGGEAA